MHVMWFSWKRKDLQTMYTTLKIQFSDRQVWVNSVDPDQTASEGAVWSMNLPRTCVHSTKDHIQLFLDRVVVVVISAFLYCRKWYSLHINARHSFVNERQSCFHWILSELAKWWGVLKVLVSLSLFEGTIKSISWQTLACLFLKIKFR